MIRAAATHHAAATVAPCPRYDAQRGEHDSTDELSKRSELGDGAANAIQAGLDACA
jgi:hypothetical protein